jgi:hypothetical protein
VGLFVPVCGAIALPIAEEEKTLIGKFDSSKIAKRA